MYHFSLLGLQSRYFECQYEDAITSYLPDIAKGVTHLSECTWTCFYNTVQKAM